MRNLNPTLLAVVAFITGGHMTGASGNITLGRRELIAKLAAVANRMQNSRRADEALQPSVHRISAYITECGKEFDLSNDEQLLFLKYIVCGFETADQLLKGEQ